MKKKLNWGLLSTARINDKIIPAINKSKYANLYAVATNRNKNIKNYAKIRKIPNYFNSYEDLIKDKNIDVIYIATPNHLHAKWIIKAVKERKNVLCEKPITISVKEINQIKKIVLKHGVTVQEATMMRFHPQTMYIRKLLDKNNIGKTKYISAIFSINMQNLNDIRFKYKNGGGSLWDLGSYCISFARYVLQKEPCKVFAKKIHTLGDEKVDASLAGYIVFEEGIEMHFFSSFRSFPFEEINIVGDKGTLKITQPYCNHEELGLVNLTKEKKINSNKSTFGDELKKITYSKKFDQNAYFNEVDLFSKTVLYREKETVSLEDSKKNIIAITALLKSSKVGRLINIKRN